MTPKGGKTDMADWLAFNGLSADQCLRLIGPVSPVTRSADPPCNSTTLWPDIALSLARALPAAAPVLSRLITAAKVDLSPDISRFPRAFTLADDGRGVPFLSCPVQGRLSDRLRLAHETGHACQYLATGRADIPPLLRETAAFLGEILLCQPAATPDDTQRLALNALLDRRQQRTAARHAATLSTALQNPGSAYDYDWNYPTAATLAARIAPDHALCWQVMTTRITLVDLVTHVLG